MNWISKCLEFCLLRINRLSSIRDYVNKDSGLKYAGYARLLEDPVSQKAYWLSYSKDGDNSVNNGIGIPLSLPTDAYPAEKTRLEIYLG